MSRAGAAVVAARTVSIDGLLNGVELANAIERLFGDGGAGGGMNVEEFAPHMGPAAGLDNPTADEQFIEPGIAVGMDDATKVLQMRLRMLALAVGRIEEQSRRRPRAGERPFVVGRRGDH